MAPKKQIDKRESLRVVTSNDLIDTRDLARLSLNARKLFYVAVAQCRMTDKEFYEFETTPRELAEMWGITRQEVYQVADKITTELMKIVITLRSGERAFRKRHLFEKCDYDDKAKLTFKLHNEMTEMLLGLKKNFSKPSLYPFMRMKSPYSMAIWHLFQKEMRTEVPYANQTVEFDLTLDELRAVTGTEKKLKQVGQFKERVLDKAIREIRDNCMAAVEYTNVKQGRKVVGFRFVIKSLWYRNPETMTLRERQQWRKTELIGKKINGKITPDELGELDKLILELDQLTLEDYAKGF